MLGNVRQLEAWFVAYAVHCHVGRACYLKGGEAVAGFAADGRKQLIVVIVLCQFVQAGV